MTSREEAAAAARALGRRKSTFKVVGRALVRNNRTLKPGTRLRLTQADADVLIAARRIEPAKGKDKPADAVEA